MSELLRPAALVLPYESASPRIDDSAWLAPGVSVIGDVEIGPDASLWYGTVVRGDVHSICIGARSNLQDSCVVHVTQGRFSTTIGEEVTVGHRAVVHGAEVRDGALVGIGAVILDGAKIGEEALVAAGALVSPGSEIPAGALAVGVPARVKRQLSRDERESQRSRALHYVEMSRRHRAAVGALPAAGPLDRGGESR